MLTFKFVVLELEIWDGNNVLVLGIDASSYGFAPLQVTLIVIKVCKHQLLPHLFDLETLFEEIYVAIFVHK